MRPPGLLRTTWIVIRKDLLIEWRTKARLAALLFFALGTLFLFSFAIGPDTRLMRTVAGAFLWLALLLSSVLSLGESFRIERENGALEGLRLTPADPRAVFLGKALSNAVILFAMGVVLAILSSALFDVGYAMGPGRLLVVLALGSLAISAPGTIHAAIASQARARDVLLPLLLFPLLMPALVGAVKATLLVMHADPMNQLDSWLELLGAFNLIYWGVGFTLFPRVIEG